MPIMRYPTENITTNAEKAPVFRRVEESVEVGMYC